MKGPAGKGHAEMAVSKTKNSDYVTPDYDGDFPMHGWDQEIPFPGLLFCLPSEWNIDECVNDSRPK